MSDLQTSRISRWQPSEYSHSTDLPRIIFWLLLVLLVPVSVILDGCAKPAQRNVRPIRFEFPKRPPIHDADPSVRHEVVAKIPTRLEVRRGESTLSVRVDPNTLKDTIFMIGANMVTGYHSEMSVYSMDDTMHARAGRLGMGSGLDFTRQLFNISTKHDSIPVAGERYIIKMDLDIFETDIPPQHMWRPGSKKYHVLWKSTIRQVIE